ncbi:uncharacterized protein MELLADRAFT_59460 [Melampsora larici-populina 98AG31]|uniref:Uncharacterized protein n=1 Tax=Melampsora larici-populina (strain 98AG31 / pathotype 3-4-7) TaxID=747676 RepID=F4R7K2_MELLP|nr:uncharacterized protein MELLADRAFT_59460 [Melampsora larici-populina 98AG31]EGG11328.1 hypothetical protein MELLADRAFT_59460 [Melampsora larici-populina 98AG31]
MKRERPETPSQEEEIARLEEEVGRLKVSLRSLEDKGVLSACAHEVQPILDDLRQEIAGLKSSLEVVQAEVSDLQLMASFEFQHVRANQMAIQKVADATGNSHIDTEEEIEVFTEERHQSYFFTRDQSLGGNAAGGDQVPVSDPHLGS